MIARYVVTLLFMLTLIGCQRTDSNLDAGTLRKLEPFFDAINRKFEAEGGFAGSQGMPDGTRAVVVRLAQTSIVDSEKELLENLSDVDEFDARNTELGDTIVDVLLNWPRLRNVNLSGTNITDAGASRLAELSHLKHLSLSDTAVTDAVVEKLKLALKHCKID